MSHKWSRWSVPDGRNYQRRECKECGRVASKSTLLCYDDPGPCDSAVSVQPKVVGVPSAPVRRSWWSVRKEIAVSAEWDRIMAAVAEPDTGCQHPNVVRYRRSNAATCLGCRCTVLVDQ